MGSIANLKGHETTSGLTFSPISGTKEDRVAVPDGYKWEPLAAWGQPLTADAPEFDPYDLDPDAQRQQVGYNCDFVSWFPSLHGSGIVCVNHEYTNPELTFANYSEDHTTKREVDHEIAAYGVSTFLVVRRSQGDGYRYELYPGSDCNRRIHGETPIAITGPVAGHPLMRTSMDPDGTLVNGTFNNCGAASLLGAPTSQRRRTSTSTSGTTKVLCMKWPRPPTTASACGKREAGSPTGGSTDGWISAKSRTR